MENASRALLMAGGILIGILVATLGVTLFNTFKESSSFVRKQIETDRLAQFNTQFYTYEGKELNIYDVIEISSIANENNEKYGIENVPSDSEKEKSQYVQVKFKFFNKTDCLTYYYNTAKKILEEKEICLKNHGNQKYKCIIQTSTITGRVYEIEINKT